MMLHCCASFTGSDSEIPMGVHRFLCRLNSTLYAVIDTARDRKALSLIEKSDCDHEMFFPEKVAPAMDGRGPHLIAVRSGSTGFERLLRDGWGNSWGIYFTGPSDFQAVLRHLRRLHFVKLHDGRQALFRFYDPRVLRAYLPLRTEDELLRFLGPMAAVYLESRSGREILSLSYDASKKDDGLSREDCCSHAKDHGARIGDITSEQMENLARALFTEKVEAAFVREVPGFSRLVAEDRAEFFRRIIDEAQAKGLKTEQGVASYALGGWWIGMNFERASKELESLLQSDYPEVRKVHAMNEWIHAYLCDPNKLVAADQKLREALELTTPWGK